jgi:hypothetical protein
MVEEEDELPTEGAPVSSLEGPRLRLTGWPTRNGSRPSRDRVIPEVAAAAITF